MKIEIREKITGIIENGFYKSTPSLEVTDEILSILDPYVRIVKEIELPKNPHSIAVDRMPETRRAYGEAQQDMIKWHNESLERLI